MKVTHMILFILLVGLLMLGWSAGLVPSLQRPSYHVLQTTKPIHVDGKLDDVAWAHAPSVGDFLNNADGSPSSYSTEAKILYDDQYLYFAFRCLDDNIWSTFTRRDEHLWTEEVVEVFLQADSTHPSYIELEVNPLGTMLDIFLLDIRQPLPYRSWNSEKLKWAVQVEGTVDGEAGDKQWTCEIALPMEDIVTAPHIPPNPGDRWRLNLYRAEKLPTKAGLAWSPTLKNDFHIPGRFGEIVFTDRQN
ncbi:carbohydrate-binding family 9-like protein [Acidobacteria bacterium AH-259-A15]|nr:carbohydrate-binding family 9-like protein [Acidobacteria bacterium AH-259-A15]